jgi:putative ABC transport system permease protein
VVKSSLPATVVGEAVRRAVLGADPDQPISRVQTVEQSMASAIAVQRFTTVLAAVFAALAQLLAAIGTFGVMSHVVASRTKEIGIRLALGAQHGRVARMIVSQALAVAAAASIAGVLATLVLGRSLGTLLFDVKPRDPVTLAAAVGVLLLTALTASYLPVRRALAQNPLQSLRSE